MGMADRQRLFFALWPDKPVRDALLRLRRHLPAVSGRPTHREDLHVTLAFLGSVDADRQRCVETVADGIAAPSFDLVIDRFGYWARPRILWCGPSDTPEALGRLVGELQADLTDCGFEPEDRPYAAHVTLARKAEKMTFPAFDPSVSWPVREFVLVASRSGGEPPRYEVLRSWRLTEGA